MTALMSSDIFTARWSFIVFVAYIVFGMCHGLFITASKASNHDYDYNTVLVILLVNLVKLLASGALFINDHINNGAVFNSLITPISAKHSSHQHQSPTSFTNLFIFIEGFQLLIRRISKNKKLMFYFLIPATLYTTYDNLMFVSLSFFTPTTYNILAQCRVVITAILFEKLFHRRLSGIQWLSLVCLTTGCVVKELYNYYAYTGEHETKDGRLTSEYLLALGCIGVQVVCSCFANVYTEFLFKDKGTRAHPMVENVFMYCDNIFCCLLALLLRGQFLDVFSYKSLRSVENSFVIAIIMNQALLGLVTATFLRKMNSIVKHFAAAIELVITPFVCWFLFDHQVDVCTVLALCIVCVASCVYASNPVIVVKTGGEMGKEKNTGFK